MAEVTGLRHNALPYPVYGAPWGVVFPMLDADGDLVTGATTPDAEVSKNGDTFADCTNESTEIATSSGMYYLLLTATEMTADVVTVIAKSASAGMKTTPIVLYPRKLVTLRTGTVGANAADGTTLQLDSSAVAIDDYYNGCLLVAVIDSTTEARVISDYVGSTKVCTVSPAFNVAPDNNDTFTVYDTDARQVRQSDMVGILATATSAPATAGILDVNVKNIDNDAASASGTVTFPNATLASTTNITAGTIATVTNVTTVNGLAAGVITAAAIATGAIDADALAADAAAEIADAVWDEDATAHQTQGTFGQAIGDPAADANTIYGAVVTGAAGATVAADIIAVKAETAAILDDTDDIGVAGAGLTALATQASVNTIDDLLDTEVAAIKTVVDDILVDTAVIGALGAGLTAIPWNAAWDAEVQSEVQDAIEVNHLDHLLAVTYDPASKPGVADALLNELVESDAGVARYTANALEQAPTGGSAPTAAAIADAVWDEAQADHVGAGSFGLVASEVADILVDTAEIGTAGAGLTNINLPNQTMDIVGNITGNLSGSVGSVTGNVGGNVTGSVGSLATQAKADVNAEVDAAIVDAALATAANLATVDTVVDTILVDTNELQTDWVNGGRLDLILDARASQVSVDDVPTNAELTAALAAADDAVLAAIAALNNLSAAQVNAEVVDALTVDALAEPTSVPAHNAALAAKLAFLFQATVNKRTLNGTTGVMTQYRQDGTTPVGTGTDSDNGTTFTKGAIS